MDASSRKSKQLSALLRVKKMAKQQAMQSAADALAEKQRLEARRDAQAKHIENAFAYEQQTKQTDATIDPALMEVRGDYIETLLATLKDNETELQRQIDTHAEATSQLVQRTAEVKLYEKSQQDSAAQSNQFKEKNAMLDVLVEKAREGDTL